MTMSRSSYKTRKTGFWRSDTPLVSKRVRIILSNKADSSKLADAIRKQRNGESNTAFELSEEVTNKLEEQK